jgi:stage II sporulation protein AA (anti-sigma F factor antagonist)
MAAPLALIESVPNDEARVVAVRGEIDVGTTPTLREWLDRASDGGRRSVAVDLDHVDFMAVSGIYVLCDEAARLAQNEAQLTVVCRNARVLRLFDVCRLADVLHVVPDRRSILPAGSWDADDDVRAARLDEWLERYSAGA